MTPKMDQVQTMPRRSQAKLAARSSGPTGSSTRRAARKHSIHQQPTTRGVAGREM
jgi:hypothetical protein